MVQIRRFLAFAAILAGLAAAFAMASAPATAQSRRVQVSGELVDTWCNVSGIMFSLGTAHHQCAVWCAIGGIPVSIRDGTGAVYMILRIDEDEDLAASPRIAKIMSHHVVVDGELIERDGVKYLLVTRVADDQGVINLTHEANGVQPFGQ